ncbi:T9SS type B sorting domain-containing protein [Flavobacterium cellulosilyticum]|uniref:T9SS type B sorting domain-containing protein n=1 Tax=Flavobacterium cellulosilyticum TaxID=2541731 RepID=A0A4R5CI82_9FLAO|nr:choice-of-anchor L domain-containing protein [Flavobacterium cellulosilyticum]TDD98809.1 T9SS type B sorting domain-containing protein [Flavobacterium cellulosilyticum]
MFCVTAQNIVVDDSYTSKNLIENILINSSCVSVSNFSATGDKFPVGQNSYGYFNNNGGSFPFKEGVVLSTWGAKNSVGPFVFFRGDGNDSTWTGDSDINQALGISSVNATVLEFDFTPLTTFLSFDYIFASNEYHDESPCLYSDGFVFLIKEKGSTTNYQNIAQIPGTTTAVTTMNLHPTTPLGTCPAINTNYYNGNNTITSPINYSGQSVVMNAQTTVIAGKTYHIKLVIADDKNQYFDSAVFIKAGTFIPKIDLGPDRLTTNNPICYGESILLDTKLPASYSYKWFKDGSNIPIPNESNSTYSATDSGTYTVEVVYTPSTCSATGKIKLEFTPEILLSNTSLSQCDPDGDGISQFDLTTVDNIIRNNNTSLSQVVYYESLSDAQANTNSIVNPRAYINKTPNPILFARVTNTYKCVNYAQLKLINVSNYIPIQNPITTCDGDTIQDGLYQFDLNKQVTPQLLSGLPNGLIVNYYLTENDALFQNNSLPTIFKNTIPYQQNIYVRIANGPNCFGITSITLKVNTFDPPNFQDETISICDGFSATLTVAPNYSSYLWNTGAVTNSIITSTAGNYSVIVTGVNGCTKTKKFFVPISGIATITGATINDFTGNNNSVFIQYTGFGNYEFSLDSLNYQDSPLFSGIAPGLYYATARDKNGCGISTPYSVYVLDYPRFFTPNGDNFNDEWKIKNLDLFPKSTIIIYDRFGKILKELNSIYPSWNGIYNGKELPSDDYWFTIKLDNGKTIKGHFSLKR